MTIDIDTATRDELLAYAKDVKHMDVKPQIRTETLRVQLGGKSAKDVATAPKAKRTKIIVQRSGDDSGGDDVFVGVNGRHYLIQRGEEVDVPEEVLHVLQNAKKMVYRTKVDRATGISTLVEREVLSYPFSIV